MIRYLCAGAVLLTVASCSFHRDEPGPQAKPMTLEQLAAGTGCKLQPQLGASELKQGQCSTGQGKYVLLTFSTEEAQSSWLTEAKPWGGRYLQGPRWVIVGTDEQLLEFRGKVGGTIVAGEDHGPAPAQGGHGH
ncbi:hypothetical protein GCM10027589_01900 [Actinocorallia lasiicapitis]